MSLARTVAWNTVLQVAGRILGLLTSFALTAILTRHLGLATYGQIAAATTYVALFAVLGDAGIYLVTVRRAAQEPGDRSRILGNALGLRLLMALVAFAIAWLLVAFVQSTWLPRATPTMLVAVALLAVNGYATLLNQFMIAIFRLHLRMDLAVLAEILARLVTLAAVALVVLLHGGMIAAIVALASGTLAQFVFAWAFARRFERFRPRLDRPIAGAMLREASVLGLVTLLGLLHFKVDTLLLWVLRSAEDVGVYSIAYKAHEVLITFPGLFVGLLFPVFSRLVREDPVRLASIFQRAFDVLVVTSVGAALAIIALAPDLATLLGAPAASTPMRILAGALPCVFVGLGFTHLVLAEERPRWLVPFYAFLVTINVTANLFAIRRWSYDGAAAVTVGSEAVALTVLAIYWLGKRRLRLGGRSLGAVPIALAVGAAAIAVHRLTPPPETVATPLLVLRAALFGAAIAAAYLGAVIGFRILPIADLRALLPRSRGAAAV